MRDPHKQIESAAALILSWADELTARAEGLEAEVAASRKHAGDLHEQLEGCGWLNSQLRAKVVTLQGELAEAELAAAEKGRP